MRLALDTNVFSQPGFLRWILSRPGVEVLLPCMAYLEFLYHHLKKGSEAAQVDAFLELHGIKVVSMNASVARRAAQAAFGRWDFRKKASDYTIGATALCESAVLVTCNKRDFEWLGEEGVCSPEEVMAGHE